MVHNTLTQKIGYIAIENSKEYESKDKKLYSCNMKNKK